MEHTGAEFVGVRKRMLREAACRPAKTAMRGGDGVLERRVPLEGYLNAKRMGEDVQDQGYWKDMERYYPEIRVGYTPRGTTVCMMTPAAGPRLGRLTRFGRATI
jgi:predicted N-acyltransferase